MLESVVALCVLCNVTAELDPQGGEFGQPQRLIAAPADARFAHLAWPKVCRCNDGTLVVACVAGRAHTRAGCPAVSRSTDAARHFTAPSVLQQFDPQQPYAHCGNVALGLAEDGAVVLLAMAFTGNSRHTILGWRSTDTGRSWKPIDTASLAENRTGSVFGNIFAIPGKGLAVWGHYRPPSEPAHGIWLAFSQDNGRCWGKPQTVAAGRYVEPAAVLAQDRLIALLRNADPGHRWRYDQAVSDDLGTTWQIAPCSIAVAPDSGWTLPSPFVAAAPHDPTRLYALQSQRGTAGDSRGRIYLWTANCSSLQWTRQGLVVSIPQAATQLADWSYPWMTPLGDGKWFLVFYAGQVSGPSSIWGMTITLP